MRMIRRVIVASCGAAIISYAAACTQRGQRPEPRETIACDSVNIAEPRLSLEAGAAARDGSGQDVEVTITNCGVPRSLVDDPRFYKFNVIGPDGLILPPERPTHGSTVLPSADATGNGRSYSPRVQPGLHPRRSANRRDAI